MSQEETEMTPAEILASLLKGKAKASYKTVARGITVRLPILDLGYVEAMAKVTGDPRNKVMTFLIRAGIDATKELLDAETLEKVEVAHKQFLREYINEEVDGKGQNVLDDSEVE